jgi:hypothetical protein
MHCRCQPPRKDHPYVFTLRIAGDANEGITTAQEKGFLLSEPQEPPLAVPREHHAHRRSPRLSLAEENEDVVIAFLGNDDVRLPIAIEISDRHILRLVPDGD